MTYEQQLKRFTESKQREAVKEVIDYLKTLGHQVNLPGAIRLLEARL